MTWVHPEAFFALVPLAAVLWFRIWRSSRVRFEVGNLALWKRVLDKMPARAKRHRRVPLEVLLEALLGVLLVAWIAQPRTTSATDGGVPLLLRDRGLTMSAAPRAAAADALVADWKRRFPQGEVVDVPKGGDDWPSRRRSWRDLTSAHVESGLQVQVLTDDPRIEGIASSVGVTIVDTPIDNVGLHAATAVPEEDGLRLFCAAVASPPAKGRRLRLDVMRGVSGEMSRIGGGEMIRGRDGTATWSGVVPDSTRGSRDVLRFRIDAQDDISADDEVVLVRDRTRGAVAVDEGLDPWADALNARGFQVRRVPRGAQAVNCRMRVVREGTVAAGTLLVVPHPNGARMRANTRALSARHAAFSDLPLANYRPAAMTEFGFAEFRPVLFAGERVAACVVDGSLFLAFDPAADGGADGPVFPLLVAASCEVLGVRPGDAGFLVARIGERSSDPRRAGLEASTGSFAILDPRASAGSSRPELARETGRPSPSVANEKSHDIRFGPSTAMIALLLAIMTFRSRRG